MENTVSKKSIALIGLLTLIAIKATDLAFQNYLSYDEYLFPPNSRVAYKTKEFDALVSINRFGFRGNETALSEGQVLVIGDSFTFGWGLNDDEVWARLLEVTLKSSGLELNVYNLGVPGTDTLFHLAAADRYVRQLKPRFVVIAVNLGDDFSQVLGTTLAKSNWKSMRESARAGLSQWFPGLLKFYVHARYFDFGSHVSVRDSLYSRYSEGQAVPSMTKAWGEDALRIVKEQNLRLADDILERAAAGDINPALLASAAARFASSIPEDVVKSAERDVLIELTRRISDASALAKRVGGRLVIFSMPNGAFVNGASTKNLRKYGIRIADDDLVTYEPETILARIAKSSDSLLVPSIAKFRHHRGAELFFPLDGHLTPEGSRLVAAILSSALLRQRGIR